MYDVEYFGQSENLKEGAFPHLSNDGKQNLFFVSIPAFLGKLLALWTWTVHRSSKWFANSAGRTVYQLKELCK